MSNNVFGIANGNDINSSPATLSVPYDTKTKYDKTTGWNIFSNIIEMDAPIFGDANGDGDVNNKDLDIIVRYIMGEEIENFIFKNADLNGDLDVNVGDVVKLIDMLK